MRLLLCVCCLFLCSTRVAKSIETVVNQSTMSISKMEKDEVVPDVVDVVPHAVVDVKFANGAEVKMGNELTPTLVKDPPNYVSWPTTPGSLYTLCMTDPDAPSRQNPKYREWHHWLVVNIPAGL